MSQNTDAPDDLSLLFVGAQIGRNFLEVDFQYLETHSLRLYTY